MADIAGFVVCVNPACDHRGDHFQYHSDTTLPIHCGGCHRVLVEHPDKRVDVSQGSGFDLDALATAVANKLASRKDLS